MTPITILRWHTCKVVKIYGGLRWNTDQRHGHPAAGELSSVLTTGSKTPDTWRKKGLQTICPNVNSAEPSGTKHRGINSAISTNKTITITPALFHSPNTYSQAPCWSEWCLCRVTTRKSFYELTLNYLGSWSLVIWTQWFGRINISEEDVRESDERRNILIWSVSTSPNEPLLLWSD